MLAGGIIAENNEDAELKKSLGLITGHAYGVLACAEVYSSNGDLC